jgi:hypothetical protein
MSLLEFFYNFRSEIWGGPGTKSVSALRYKAVESPIVFSAIVRIFLNQLFNFRKKKLMIFEN